MMLDKVCHTERVFETNFLNRPSVGSSDNSFSPGILGMEVSPVTLDPLENESILRATCSGKHSIACTSTY